MTVHKNNGTALVRKVGVGFPEFLDGLKEVYPTLKEHHIVLDLLALPELSPDDLYLIVPVSEGHKARGKSFVLVTDQLSYDEVPDELTVAPTVEEANDVIEMEDIERELGL